MKNAARAFAAALVVIAGLAGVVLAQPYTAPGLSRVAHDGSMAGSGTTAAPLSVETSYIQRRVSGTCTAGSSIRVIAADGTVTCESDDDSIHSAGAGLTLLSYVLAIDPTYTQRRVSGTCAVGSSIRVIDQTGTVTCETDDDSGGDLTAITAGTGIAVTSGTGPVPTVTLAMTAQSCSAGQHISAATATGAFTCTADSGGGAGDVTDVNPTSGGFITVTNPTGPAPSVGLSTACGTNQIPKWSGSAWACGSDVDTDTNTTYSGTAGRVPLTGTTFDLASGIVTAGSCLNCNLTVDTYGRVTAQSNGSGGGLTGTLTSGNVPRATGTSTLGTGSWSDTGSALSTANPVTISSGGTALNLSGGSLNVGANSSVGGNETVYGIAADNTHWTYLNEELANTSVIHWSNTGTPASVRTLALSLYSTGVLQIQNGSGADASYRALNGTLSGALVVGGTSTIAGLETATGGVTTPANLTTTSGGDIVSNDQITATNDVIMRWSRAISTAGWNSNAACGGTTGQIIKGGNLGQKFHTGTGTVSSCRILMDTAPSGYQYACTVTAEDSAKSSSISYTTTTNSIDFSALPLNGAYHSSCTLVPN